MSIKVLSTDLHIVNTRLRMPFRFGIVTLTELPHLFVRAIVQIDGKVQEGLAADFLPNKWLTKNPSTTFEQDIVRMLEIIKMACQIAQSAGSRESVFDLWEHMYMAHSAWAGGWGDPPLLAAFGPSLVERAIIDAFCKQRRITFSTAVRENQLGIRLGRIHAELSGVEPRDLLPREPERHIIVRHTVGLTDPLTDKQIAAADRVDDGLPQSLEACVAHYGLSYFKIKLWGDVARDQERVAECADVLGRLCRGPYAFTLDGNENFKAVEPFREFWAGLTQSPKLREFLSHLIFVEQPLHRDVALNEHVAEAFANWKDRPPIIIDESDGTTTTVKQAVEMGYAGSSHKNCKGVIKGIANGCLLAHRRKIDPYRSYIQSAEDLTNIGPVALMQDLSVLASLGINHAERNGHHYFRGLSMFPRDLADATLAAHPDLYLRDSHGTVTARIEDGTMRIGSVVDKAFGVGAPIDPSRFTPVDDWKYASLLKQL